MQYVFSLMMLYIILQYKDIIWSPLDVTTVEINNCSICITVYLFLLDGPGSRIAFNPADVSITKMLGQNLGLIVCSAQCNPPCQFLWIKPDGTVLDGPNLEIPSLSKNDHGAFTCHTGNGYGNNSTRNLQLNVNCKYLKMFYFEI